MRLIYKKDILREIVECAKVYNKNLAGKNIIFIYPENQKFKFIETKFLKSNFFHLTGLESKNINPNYFYEKCINNKINEDELLIKKDGTTDLKIEVLRNLMSINKSGRIIGDFDATNLYLSTNKIIGNIRACLGFKNTGLFYVPNTALKKDIRKITINNNKIVCIMSKEIQSKNYQQITYLNKNFTENKELLEMINKLMKGDFYANKRNKDRG